MDLWQADMKTAGETFALLESIFSNLSDAVVVVDKTGTIVAGNQSLERMTGWQKEELIGLRHICEICKGMATCSEDMTCTECFFKQARMTSFEMWVQTRDGKEFPVAASSTRLPDTANELIVMILRDMSEQLQAERVRNQQKLTNYVIHAQEEERKRISRELHDGVGQALYSIVVGLNVVSQFQVDEQVKELLTDVQDMTMRAMEEVKRMAVELRPSALDDLGLLPAIRSYVKRFEQTFGIEVELVIIGKQRRYQPAVETALYRILQEAMTNSAKYADADKMKVIFQEDQDRLELIVIDYGIGFDPKQLTIQGTGLGLFGMKERAHLLEGTVEIESSVGAGTKIHIVIPLKERSQDVNSRSDL